jgi:hypothetical protein
MQLCGSAEASVEFAVLNGLSLTDEPGDIDIVILPDVIDAEIVSYFAKREIVPATYTGIIPELIATPIDSYISYESILQSDEIVVLEGQNFFDLALIYCGSAESAVEFAQLNDMVVTDEPEAGTKLKKPSVSNKRIAGYYSDRTLQPSTSTTYTGGSGELPNDEGIGFWAIEIDFIVS